MQSSGRLTLTSIGVADSSMEIAEEDFYATEPGQFIANAYRYLSAAKLLRFPGGENASEPRHLVPLLHLTAHGTELLLKYPLLRSGLTQAEVRRLHGHNLASLWEAPEAASLKAMLFERADTAWAEARASGDWPNDDFSGEPRAVLAAAIRSLSFAHDKGSGFALRYTLPSPTISTPRPAFLLQVLEPAAETICKDPGHLERWYPIE